MATLKDYTGVLSHHLKLVTDSSISPAALHALHSSGLFSTLLQCEEPHLVNREALADLLGVRERRRPLKELCDLARRKLAQAARAREKHNLGGPNNWFEYMGVASELLRAIYQQIQNEFSQQIVASRVDILWQPLNNRYHAEASAMLFSTAYGRVCELEDARSSLREAMKIEVPCHVCRWTGNLQQFLECGACKGRKLLPVHVITCPECNGSGDGFAYAGTDGLGVCPLCLDGGAEAGKIFVDSLNKPVMFGDPGFMLRIPQTF